MPPWGSFKVLHPEAVTRVVAPYVARKAEEVRSAAQARTPEWAGPLYGGRVKGELRDAWKAEPVSPLVWRVFNDTEYAWYVEYGSVHNPHPAGMLGEALAIARASP
ncbi:MAG: HK97 gp10 family phage protein [Actinobacteria bacterium]|nr:HK97 gp10 family phage protein [Actinomycetota bacterium]